MALQEDPRGPVIEMMQEAAMESESASRDIVETSGVGGVCVSICLCGCVTVRIRVSLEVATESASDRI